MKKLTTEQFIKRAKEVHGDKYDYSSTVYQNSRTKVTITCPLHRGFEQKPTNHLQGQGCPICVPQKIKSSKKQFTEKAQVVHGDKYDYSLVKYVNNKTKVQIICREHGIFEQTPNNHLSGNKCPKCKKNIMKEVITLSINEFIVKAKEVHGDKYDYSRVNYINSHEKIEIICKEHGSFWQKPNNHLQGQNCYKCSNNGQPSKKEQELYNFIEKLITVEQSNKTILNGKELDIYIPSKEIAIEFNGLYWHSDKYKNNNYHLEKTIECQKKGIRLIHIFEDEWDNKKEILKSRLLNILSRTQNKVFARKCEIKGVNTKEKTKFLNENHMQGAVGSIINLGLYFENELVSLMTFGKLRKNLGSNHKEGHYELLRFCNKLNTSVVGGASKLLKHFQKNYKYKEIVSYCDLRWSDGNLYNQLYFQEVHRTKSNYFYIKGFERLPRFKYRKSELIKQGFDKNKTEKEIMKNRGFLRIYDCGTIKFKIIK